MRVQPGTAIETEWLIWLWIQASSKLVTLRRIVDGCRFLVRHISQSREDEPVDISSEWSPGFGSVSFIWCCDRPPGHTGWKRINKFMLTVSQRWLASLGIKGSTLLECYSDKICQADISTTRSLNFTVVSNEIWTMLSAIYIGLWSIRLLR